MPLYQDVLAARQLILGEDHPETRNSQKALQALQDCEFGLGVRNVCDPTITYLPFLDLNPLRGLCPFFTPPTERKLARMAKICRLPKGSRNTIINANIGDTTNTHSQDPDQHIQQKCLLELKALTGKSGPPHMAAVLQRKKMNVQSIGAGVYFLHPTAGGTSINKTRA